MSGPFKGLRYVRFAYGSVLLPKIIGTYESELHSIINTLDKERYKIFIDIGAAEGYYAVGLGRLLSKTRGIAFEKSYIARLILVWVARRNKVKLEIYGNCRADNLVAIIKNPTPVLIVMDIEGAEFELINDVLISKLKYADILIEIHPEAKADSFEWMKVRFKDTHIVQSIPKQSKKSIPPDVLLSKFLRKRGEYLTDEFRGDQYWLWLKSKFIDD